MSSTAAPSPASPVEQLVRRLWELQKNGRHSEASRDAQALLREVPENRDVLLAAARSFRHLGRICEAQEILAQLERLHPGFSLLHQERGFCHVQLRDAPRAIEALLRAVNINPALPASWSMLESLYRLTGDIGNAATAAAHVARLKSLPGEVVRATALFSDGDLVPAEQLIRAYLTRHGEDVEAMRLLAKIGMANDVLDDAELLLEAVLARAPDYRAARHDYARALVDRHKYTKAAEQIEQLLALDPSDPDYRGLAATTAVGLGQHERAIDLYQGMLADWPDHSDVHLWLGHALKTIGRTSEAVKSYRNAAATRPDFGDAYWSLANLKSYRFRDEELAQMRTREAAPESTIVDRYHLCFALGKAYEDRREFGASWQYYARGNALKRAQSRYRPEIWETNTRKQIEVCTRDFFRQRTRWGISRPDPIFIVGLPRSGSTLIEQILASHPLVDGTQELADIPRIVLHLEGRNPELHNPRYPGNLARLSRDDFRSLGETYLRDTQAFRTGKPFFIDKMPNNFRHIGLIHLMLPNAKIIDVRREPISCCFSNLKQLYAHGQEFTYSIEDISRYYRTYLDLMEHWNDVLRARILRVHYEDVVDDLEGSVRRLLEHCGIPFDLACVQFHKTQRSVMTPSSEQVRRPIFRDGTVQWKNYEPWLEPLKESLGGALLRYREQ
jgi:predicted Zn-dependent protease